MLERGVSDGDAVVVEWHVLGLSLERRGSRAVHINELLSGLPACWSVVDRISQSQQVDLSECSGQSEGDRFLARGPVIFVVFVFSLHFYINCTLFGGQHFCFYYDIKPYCLDIHSAKQWQVCFCQVCALDLTSMPIFREIGSSTMEV